MNASYLVNNQSYKFLSLSLSPLMPIEIGDYCRLTSNCVVDKTTCQHGQCRCFFGYHANMDKTRCLKNINLGEKCYADEECVVENASCQDYECRCRASHVPSQEAPECLPIATSLYQTCQLDSQCSTIPNAYCSDNSTCVCSRDHHDINAVRIIKNSTPEDQLVTFEISFNFFQRCFLSVRLNGICESDENCVVADSSCANKRCTCDEGFSETRDKFCSHATSVQISSISMIIVLVIASMRLFL
jgi:hypothetical protein